MDKWEFKVVIEDIGSPLALSDALGKCGDEGFDVASLVVSPSNPEALLDKSRPCIVVILKRRKPSN